MIELQPLRNHNVIVMKGPKTHRGDSRQHLLLLIDIWRHQNCEAKNAQNDQTQLFKVRLTYDDSNSEHY